MRKCDSHLRLGEQVPAALVSGEPRRMRRRDFLRTCLGAGAAVGVPPALAAGAEPVYPHRTLEEAFTAAGFDACKDSSFTVVWAADTHYGTGDADAIGPPILREINALEPPPAFFGIAGDLICKASRSFGQVPDDKQKQEAIAEFRLLREALRGLDPRVPVKLALGNHDTYPGEGDPALFHAVFPEHPPYHAFTVQDVRFVFLNGGSNGVIDAAQRAWFRAEIQKNHRPGATLVTVVHQPALGSVVAERGIPAAYREALADAEGDLWMVSGHAHHNRDACFRLPKAVITQATITTGNPAGWGEERPGYWVYGFTGGRLAVRVFRRLGQGYAIAPPPPRAKAGPIRLPFEGHQQRILWKVLVGEGDRPYLVDARAAWCLNYWHYNKQLTYRFPLSLAQGRATRFTLLGGAPTGKEPPRFFASPDGQSWEEITDAQRDGGYTRFAIPPACQDAGTLALRLEGCVVGGFALER